MVWLSVLLIAAVLAELSLPRAGMLLPLIYTQLALGLWLFGVVLQGRPPSGPDAVLVLAGGASW
jgi:hypothetical protein